MLIFKLKMKQIASKLFIPSSGLLWNLKVRRKLGRPSSGRGEWGSKDWGVSEQQDPICTLLVQLRK